MDELVQASLQQVEIDAQVILYLEMTQVWSWGPLALRRQATTFGRSSGAAPRGKGGAGRVPMSQEWPLGGGGALPAAN